MPHENKNKYCILDQPYILNHLFHPRAEDGNRPPGKNRDDIMIPLDGDINIGASFHFISNDAPLIVFFHGNGEIVSDYDDFGTLYNGLGINFFVVDYRGYGNSNGSPSITSMMDDCQKVFDFVLAYMSKMQLTGRISIMGRSLGSATAIELCATRAEEFNSLIIESGFARISPLLEKLGVDPQGIGFKDQKRKS